MSSLQPEYEELSLTSVTGLQTVFRNIQQLYQRGLAIEAERLIPATSAVGKRFHNAYQAVRQELESLISETEKGIIMSTAAATALQTKYDAFVEAERALVTYQEQTLQVTTPEVSLSTPTVPHHDELRMPTRTSVVVAVQSVESTPQTETEIETKIEAETETEIRVKKKKRKRKKRPSPDTVLEVSTPPTPHLKKLQYEIYAYEKKAAPLREEILAAPVESEVHERTQSLHQELRSASVQSLELIKAPETPYLLEKLSYFHTLAETAFTELTLLHDYVRTVMREAVSPSVDETVAIPITSAVTTTVTPDTSERVSFVPATIVTKAKNPVHRSVPKQLVSLAKPEAIHEPFSLTETYLTSARYKAHIIEHYSSIEAFERILDASVTTLESETIDSIDRWLGDTPASAFHYVKDMPLPAFVSFASSGYDQITEQLQAQNIRYETFLVWRDLYDEMISIIHPTEAMVYGELFARFMIENDIASLREE